MMYTRKAILIFRGLLLLLLVWRLLQTVRQHKKQRLYIRIGNDGSMKMGTCKHCVVREYGRPARAWNANGDRELDFPRDQLTQRLAAFGLHIEIEQEYVCP